MTKTELQDALDAAGVEYPASATKAELMALMPAENKSTDQLTEEALAEATEQQEKAPEPTPKARPKPPPGVPAKGMIKVRTAKHGTKLMTQDEYDKWRKEQQKGE